MHAAKTGERNIPPGALVLTRRNGHACCDAVEPLFTFEIDLRIVVRLFPELEESAIEVKSALLRL
jgi:hypothetical protein